MEMNRTENVFCNSKAMLSSYGQGQGKDMKTEQHGITSGFGTGSF